MPKAEEETVINVPHGDNSLLPKGVNHTRVALCNLNGIPPHDEYAKAKEVGEAMLRHQVDIGAFTEPKLNFSMRELRHKIHSKFRPYFKQSRFAASSADPVEENRWKAYQPGGTCTIVGDPAVGRVCDIKVDNHLGRWNCITLKGKQNKHFTIITAYQVNRDTVQGTLARSTWKQQYRVLKKHHSNPDPRVRFWKDLEILIGRYKQKRHEVMLLLDANDPEAKELDPIMSRKGMKELYIAQHGIDNEPETHIRGSS
jgi:hypothetical protein